MQLYSCVCVCARAHTCECLCCLSAYQVGILRASLWTARADPQSGEPWAGPVGNTPALELEGGLRQTQWSWGPWEVGWVPPHQLVMEALRSVTAGVCLPAQGQPGSESRFRASM